MRNPLPSWAVFGGALGLLVRGTVPEPLNVDTYEPKWVVRLNRRVLAGLTLGIVCVVFVAAAMSRHVYQITSPGDLASHIVLRKLYSIVAFCIVGIILSFALPRPSLINVVLGVAAFSTLIEIAQHLDGVREPIVSNVFDIGCGAFGGYIGYVVAGRLRRQKT